MPLNLGALLGGNKGQPGLIDQIRANQQRQQGQQIDASTMQALQQYAMQQNQGAVPSPQPGNPAALPSDIKPSMPPQPPTGAPGAGGMAVSTQGAPQQGGQATPTPRSDTMQMIDLVSKMPNLNDTQKYQVLQKMGAYMSPIEKYTQQLDMASQKLSMQQQMLDEKMKNAVMLQSMRDDTSRSNTGARVAATERGQDIGASNVDKRVGATERGQDIRSEDTNRNIDERSTQAEDTNKIRQQQADTASDRAGTYKYSTMQNAMVKQQLADSKGKVDTAKIKKLESTVATENKKPFQAAKDKFDKAASLYQSLTRPGATPAADPADIKFAKDKMDKFEAEMNGLAGGASGSQPLPAGIKSEDITPENLQHTADKYGITVDEVKAKLGVK